MCVNHALAVTFGVINDLFAMLWPIAQRIAARFVPANSVAGAAVSKA